MRIIPPDVLPAVERMISHEIHAGNRTQQRDAIAIALGLHGMRIGEVCRARREELYVAGRQLVVPQFKRGNPRTLELHGSLVEAILHWRAAAANELLLYTATGHAIHPTHLRRVWKRLIARMLSDHFRFHDLRHTFATRLYHESNHDQYLVKQKLGHKSIKSTEVYVHSAALMPAACLIKLCLENESVTHGLKLFCPAG
jgi:integrase